MSYDVAEWPEGVLPTGSIVMAWEPLRNRPDSLFLDIQAIRGAVLEPQRIE